MHFPVNAVLAGRRNSPPDPEIGLPPLAVYNPIHYQELPELFMEFHLQPDGQVAVDHRIRQRRRADQRPVQRAVAGGGSEQRAGVGDPDRLCGLHDLGRATSGRSMRVDHDISMLVPEIWCRMRVHERDPRFLIEKGLLERVEDFRV